MTHRHTVSSQCFVSSTAVPTLSSLNNLQPLTCLRNKTFTPSYSVIQSRPRTSTPVHNRTETTRCCVERPAWKQMPVDVDFAKDEQLEILEEDLNIALASQDYTKATTLQDKIQRLQSGASMSVLSINLKFYHSLNEKSIVDMASCWHQSTTTTCKFPGGHLVMGYINIINSFGYLFTYDMPRMEIRNCHIYMRGSVGYDEDGQKIVTCATNIYMKKNGQWYLYHHTSVITESS